MKWKKKLIASLLSQIENLQAENPLLRKDFWHGQKLMSLTEKQRRVVMKQKKKISPMLRGI